MFSNDWISDSLARLQNSIVRKKKSANLNNTKMVRSLLDILVKEGFVNGYEVEGRDLIVDLKYNKDGSPVVSKFIRVSKLGQRIYVTADELLPVMNGRGISVISTSSGLMNGALAKSKKIGGEYICKIW